MEEALIYKFSAYSKFESYPPVTLWYLFKNCSSHFFSHLELAELVFCIEELNCLLYKNPNKSLTLSSLSGKYFTGIMTL